MDVCSETSSAAAVLQAVGASLQSLLGPYRSAKLLEGWEEEEGGLIMADSMQVLSALADQIQHSAGHVIHSGALGHHGNYGCGVTGLVCVASSLSQQVAQLVKQGVHFPLIFAVFDECLVASESAISTLSQPLTEIRHEYTRSTGSPVRSKATNARGKVSLYSRHSQRAHTIREESDLPSGFLEHIGRQLSHGREMAMQLAVAAIKPQTRSLTHTLELRKVMSLQTVGVATEHSRVERGVVCRLPREMLEIVRWKRSSTLRTVVLCGAATETFTHRGTKRDVKISSVLRSCDLQLGSHDPWLSSWKQFFSKFSIGFVALEGAMSPSLFDHCLSEGIVVVTHLPPSHTHTLTHLSGTRPIHYISQIRHEGDVGMVRVREIEGGWSKVKVRQSTKQNDVITNNYFCAVQSAVLDRNCEITTAILCGHTHSQTSILEHSFRSCLSRLRCVMSDGCVVRGGGCVEESSSRRQRNKEICHNSMSESGLHSVLHEDGLVGK